ncbi:DUF2189 domain-containing protein [Ferrovibrio sp.]|uniref:DUF2189 domain-containing protein n=1 Tax=Ferrovibrio sp. TaxID=1917215 RepID=UPI0035B404FE
MSLNNTDASPMAVMPTGLVRRVPDDRPWYWLILGWRDITRAPQVSLAYGAGLVGFSFLLVFGLSRYDMLYLFLPMAGGFFLIAPLAAVGLYETSRRLSAGLPVDLYSILTEWRRPMQVALFGLVLLLLHFAWVRVALLWFALYFNGTTPPLDALPFHLLEPANLPFLVVGGLLGGIFALLAFAISAVSLPMLVDRDVDPVTAIVTSVNAVRRNPKAMLLWAGLIVLFTAVGIATFFVGLGLLFPLVAHATWHAYKDLVV